MNTFKRFFWACLVIAIFALGFALMPAMTFGQEAAPDALAAQASSADGGNVTLHPTQPSPIQALVAFAVPLLIAAFKSRIPERFRKFIPIIAPILGEVLSQLVTSLPAGSGALGGLAGVGLREIKDQHTNKSDRTNKADGPNYGATYLLFMIGFTAFIGCARLKPGADPVVVRAEQTAQMADATFRVFLNLENDRRGFYRTNVPALHAAAEWLRARQPVSLPDGSQTNLARADAMIVNLVNVKRAYQTGRTNRNAVITTIDVLAAAAREAGTWNNVLTNGGFGGAYPAGAQTQIQPN